MNLTKMVISEDESRIMLDGGREFISVDKIINNCVELCIRYVDTSVVTVYETERDSVENFELLFRDVMKDDRLLTKFQNEYIRRRFIDRQKEELL